MAMNVLDRKAELVRKAVTVTSIARELNVTSQHVSQVLSGERRSPRVEQAIATALELPAEDVFGPAPTKAAA